MADNHTVVCHFAFEKRVHQYFLWDGERTEGIEKEVIITVTVADSFSDLDLVVEAFICEIHFTVILRHYNMGVK